MVWRLLSEVDRLSAEQGPLDDVVLWAALLLEPLKEACAGSRDRVGAGGEFLEPVVDRLNVPRRIADAVRRIVAVLPRLEAGKASRFARTRLYPPAATVLELSQASRGQRARPGAAVAAGGPQAAPGGQSRRRRRRRTRRSE